MLGRAVITIEELDVTTPREYLEMVANFTGSKNGKSFESFELEYGREFEFAPYDDGKWGPKGALGECFSNAMHLARANPDELVYCEGHCTTIIPMLHAFCVEIATGKVVDPTWDDKPGDFDGWYWGVPFTEGYVCETALRREYYGLIDDWSDGYPLVMGEHDVSDFRDTRLDWGSCDKCAEETDSRCEHGLCPRCCGCDGGLDN